MQPDFVSWIDYPAAQDELVHDRMSTTTEHASFAHICISCGAVNNGGRWYWDASRSALRDALAVEPEPMLCPACRQCRERQAAGTVLLEMVPSSQSEPLLREVVHAESRRMIDEDPMHRVIDIERQENGLVITTTTIELARAIGEAVQRKIRGHLEMHYGKPVRDLRVRWLPWD